MDARAHWFEDEILDEAKDPADNEQITDEKT